MKYQNEIKILKITKYLPPLFILLLSAITLTLIYWEHQRNFLEEKKQIEKEFIDSHRQAVKNQVNTVINFIKKEQVKTEVKLKESIKKRIYEVYDVVMHIYEENKTLPKEQLAKRVKDALRNFRFNENRGYFFINTMDGYNVMHGLTRAIEGKNLWNFQTSDGNYVVQDIVNKLQKNNETFHEWYWQKNKNDSREYRKVGFLKKIEVFNWYIGTAEYVDDYEKMVQKDILDRVKHFKFEKNNYIFVFHADGTYLVHARKHSIGKNIYDSNVIVDENGNVIVDRVFKGFVDLAQTGGGYITYRQVNRPTNSTINKRRYSDKTTYINGIKNWNWVIGKGFYEDEVNVILDKKRAQVDLEFKGYLEKILTVTIILSFFLLILSLLFSKFMESKFADYKKEIQNYVEENNQQQNMLAQQSKMAAMGEMIGNIAHQWRQPLSVISTAATGMKFKKEMNTLEDDELIKTLDTINDKVQHLSHTIDDFRNFFAPNKQKVKFNTEELIERAISLVSAQFTAKDIQIIKNVQSHDVTTFDRELLQVLINILNNAKDALENRPTPRYIFIECKVNDNELQITIKDNAGGIKEEIINKIFEPYFTTKHKNQGTGIGLFMSQEIVHKHLKGRLDVFNEEYTYNEVVYKGAMFKISFQLT